MMHTDPEAAAGAPGNIELGGRLYAVAQATDADLMEVRRWLKKHVPNPLRMYAEVAKDPHFRTLPKKARDELAKEAAQLQMRGETPLTGELAADMLMEAKHCAFLAWVLLRTLNPEVTYEAMKQVITDENAGKVFMDLHAESGMDSMGN